MENKIKRVQFFYEDGNSIFIEGDELEKWTQFNLDVAVLAAAKGCNPKWEEINWKQGRRKVKRNGN